MPSKTKAFLLSTINRKVLLFFLENQGSIDTPRGVAAWISENIQKVRMALEELVEAGYLKAHRTSSTIGYSSALSRKELTHITAELKN